MSDYKALIQDVFSSPMGEMIASVGEGVAQAQAALDEGSLATMLDIYSESDDDKLRLMREIGYRPTFYALPETTGELQISMRMGQTGGASATGTPRLAPKPVSTVISPSAASSQRVQTTAAITKMQASRARIYATPSNAAVNNRYNFNASASAKLTFKIVPIPAPEAVDAIRVVPNIVGRTREEAAELLAEFDLLLSGDPASTTKVKEQVPAAGEIVRADDVIEPTFE